MDKEPFKSCPRCNTVWPDRETFLCDPGMDLIGYQPLFENLEAGFFLFNHDVSWCKTTVAIPAGEFTDLYDGPVFEDRLTDGPTCGGHCQREGDIEPCPNRCECAYVRAVLQIVKNWPRFDAPVTPPYSDSK